MNFTSTAPRPTRLLDPPGTEWKVPPVEILYRYKESVVHPGRVVLRIESYPVVALTDQGYWIKYEGTKKWVSGKSEKRFAYPYKIQALNSYYRRKNRQVEILEYQLALAKQARWVTMRQSQLLPTEYLW
jgi:hypothetical protein